jgi:hypothetical protein
VDPRPRHAGAVQLGGEPARERLGPAQEDLAVPQVGDEPAQRGGVERHVLARADQLVEPAAAASDLLGDLVAVHDLLVRGRARSSTATSASGGSSPSSASTGAVPTPAPTSSSRSRSAASAMNVP